MRSVLVAIGLTLGCGARQTAWTPVAPQDLDGGGDAFVLIGMNALHLSHVEVVDGRVRARVVQAWQLPRAGAAAVQVTPGASPEEIARRAGWRELGIADARFDVPATWIRDAHERVGVVEDDVEPWYPDDHPLVTAIILSVADVVLNVTR